MSVFKDFEQLILCILFCDKLIYYISALYRTLDIRPGQKSQLTFPCYHKDKATSVTKSCFLNFLLHQNLTYIKIWTIFTANLIDCFINQNEILSIINFELKRAKIGFS